MGGWKPFLQLGEGFGLFKAEIRLEMRRAVLALLELRSKGLALDSALAVVVKLLKGLIGVVNREDVMPLP